MKLVRKNAVVVILLVALCYILGLVTASYFTRHGAHLAATLTRLLRGKVPPFIVMRTFNETIYYVTDRKEGPRSNGYATYVSEYAGQVSYGFMKLQIPEDRPAGSQINDDVIRKVESIPYENFIRLLQDQAAKPLVVWIHGYR